MKELLILNQIVLIDDCDYHYVLKYHWTLHKQNGNYYVVRDIIIDGKQNRVYLHREIMKTPSDLECDHKDGNTLNYQRYNLRNCTHAQNNMNKKVRSDNTSGYKGVCWDYIREQWCARITFNGKKKCLGYFKDKEDAARAYNQGALKHHGEFANLNIITEVQ